MKVQRIDHITLRVNNMQKATELFSSLFGTKFNLLGEFKDQGIRMSVDQLGIGIAEPLSPETPFAKMIEKRGEGVSALSVKVENLDEAIAEMAAKGVRNIGRQNEKGFRAAIFHPADTFGVMIELIEYKDEHPLTAVNK